MAISGGIDSLVAAHLLTDQGADLIGIHFITGFETGSDETDPMAAAAARIRPVSEQLNIPVHVVDARQPFYTAVIRYFVDAYHQGHTPNPCLQCNARIKFGWLKTVAARYGATCLATGHYVQTCQTQQGVSLICQGADQKKDQSYFLGFLSPQQIRTSRFPLGALTKADIKAYAARHHLVPVQKKESQDICFITGRSYREFLENTGNTSAGPGPVVDTTGRVLGQHKGLQGYTVGQRRGLGIPGPEPYYVLSLDTKTNQLVIGFKAECYQTSCRVRGLQWHTHPSDEPLFVRLRYSHQPVRCEIHTPQPDPHTAVLRFAEPQLSVTPGQGAVFYDTHGCVIGAGWIDQTVSESRHR